MKITVEHIDDDFEAASGTKEFVFHSKYVPSVGDSLLLPAEVYPYECEVDSVTWDFTQGSNETALKVLIKVTS